MEWKEKHLTAKCALQQQAHTSFYQTLLHKRRCDGAYGIIRHGLLLTVNTEAQGKATTLEVLKDTREARHRLSSPGVNWKCPHHPLNHHPHHQVLHSPITHIELIRISESKSSCKNDHTFLFLITSLTGTASVINLLPVQPQQCPMLRRKLV